MVTRDKILGFERNKVLFHRCVTCAFDMQRMSSCVNALAGFAAWFTDSDMLLCFLVY